MIDSEQLEPLWRSERPRLVGLATAMLRDRAAAEDVVQEVFVRVSARGSAEGVRNPAAWLSVVTANLCLDVLKSAAWRRETTAADEGSPAIVLEAARSAEPDPADRVTLDDQVRRAMLVVLDRLTPEERVSFLLHDVFGLRFAEIAELVGTSEANSRQLAHRARGRLAAGGPATVPTERQRPAEDRRAVLDRFVAACRGGSLDALVAVLRTDVWGVASAPGGRTLGESRGRHDVAITALRFLGPPTALVVVDGEVYGFRDGHWLVRIEFDLAGDLVRSLVATVDTRPW